MVRIKKSSIILLAIIYIYIPVFIFLIGFVRPLISIPVILGLLYCAYDFYVSLYNRNGYREISVVGCALALIILTAAFILLGAGGFYPQAGDWFKHNAVLRDLTIKKWPVIYSQREKASLTYYIGQYLLPAILGKAFSSFEYANIFMMIFGLVGLYIVYLVFVYAIGLKGLKEQVAAAAFILFFSGAIPLAQLVLKGIYGEDMYSLGQYHWILVRGIMLQYRSNLVMIRWVYPQAIVPWIVVGILYIYRNKLKEIVKYLAFLIIPVLLFASFSFVALVIIAISIIAYVLLNDKIIFVDKMTSVFSKNNIIVSFTLGIVLFFYFSGNIFSEKPVSSSFGIQDYSGGIFVYIVFVLFTFGIYALCVFQENKRDLLFYVNAGILLALPLLKMGLLNDIVMSASIPSLFYYCITVTRHLLDQKPHDSGFYIRKGILIVVFIIGAWYPLMELKENIAANQDGMELGDGYITMEQFTERNNNTISEDLRYNYYTYGFENKVFYRFISKK